ncbi:MAG: extracellular solute-binding protein [Defluviitaleaceae bacterium]|nr:extracellular solute-binding protein [Defluviitaleaceae bacterium]
MKRLFKPFMAVLIACFMLLAACGQGGGAGTAETPADTLATPVITSDWGSMGLTSGGVPISDPGQFPIVQNRGDITVEIMVTGHPTFDWNNNDMTRWMEEMTNIVVNWRVIPLEGRADTLNLELTSANYPDAFKVVGFNQAHVNRFGVGEGRLMPITDLIPLHAPNLMEILEEFPNYEGIMTMLDGEIYVMPNINQCFHCTMFYKMWINQDFLDEVDMEIPTTTDELLTVLRAFRDEIPGSIPFAGTFTGGWGSTLDYFIMNAFTFYDAHTLGNGPAQPTLGLFVDNGVVKTPWNQPGTIEGLRFLNQLVREGLLHEGSLTGDGSALIALVESGDTARVGMVTGGHGAIFSDMAGYRYPLYVPVMPFAGPDGRRVFPQNTNDLGFNGFYISADSNYAEALVKWADLLYTFEATMRGYFGPAETNWRLAEPGEYGIDGNPAIYTILVPWQETEPQSYHWNQFTISNRTAAFRAGEAFDTNISLWDPEGLEAFLFQTTEQMLPFANSEKIFPPVKFTDDQTSDMSVPLTDVTSIIRQWIPGFVAGVFDIDTQYDEFLELLENAGLSFLLEHFQAAYDLLYGQ